MDLGSGCGLMSLSTVLLQASLGERAAADVTPLTFALPDEIPEWKRWLRNHREGISGGQGHQRRPQGERGRARIGPEAGGATREGTTEAEGELWMLKTGQDAGAGGTRGLDKNVPNHCRRSKGKHGFLASMPFTLIG